MEASDIPIYPLASILKMSDAHKPVFVEFLRITSTIDVVGQIAIKLNNIGKLSMAPPINKLNLSTLIRVSLPRVEEPEDPMWGNVERYQRMLHYVTAGEFQTSIGNITEVNRPIETDPTVLIDPTIEVEDRDRYFELSEDGFGIYTNDPENDGPYESSFHNSVASAVKSSGQLYLLYGTVQPDLSRLRDVIKTLYKSLGWMPDIKTKGWAAPLRQMGESLRQQPMDFVGLILVVDGKILQVNSNTVIFDGKTGLIKSTPEIIVAASKSGTVVEDYLGDSISNEGVWFEIPTLDPTSPRISLAGLRCTHETEIIGTAKFRVLELTECLVKSGRLKMPKLKTNILYL